MFCKPSIIYNNLVEYEDFSKSYLTFFCSLEDGIFTIMPELNWNGTITASIYAINNFNVSDTSTFTIDVLSVNDSPEPYSLIYPTITDTISISTDTDEIIQFKWEESVDVDIEVNASGGTSPYSFQWSNGSTGLEEFYNLNINDYQWPDRVDAKIYTSLNLIKEKEKELKRGTTHTLVCLRTRAENDH